ncbi:GntR family transcriptional regulator [Streptomyces flavidovirens]|uniref:GntR family transcriptional regulator n=1 Tax=Streptomyces flavidovirens TaxID=67298 RepID=UPI00344015DC
MAGNLKRPSPMYKQLADQLAEAIASGELEPGVPLPSETKLMQEYGVSRPTVRSAVAELRTMGLVDSEQGRGSFVRNQDAAPSVTLARTLRRSGKRFEAESAFSAIESPTITRTHITGAAAALLERDEEAAFAVERLLSDPVTGARYAHRTVIPLDVAEAVPQLAERPDAELTEIYATLTEAGHALTWQESVTARAPLPDERAALGVSDGAPVLVSRRVTYSGDDRPLLLEELRASAAHTQLTFRITPEKAPTRRRAGSV